MGLSVIRGIMLSHGGHIIVETEIGKGSTFRLLFPPVVENGDKTDDIDELKKNCLMGMVSVSWFWMMNKFLVRAWVTFWSLMAIWQL